MSPRPAPIPSRAGRTSARTAVRSGRPYARRMMVTQGERPAGAQRVLDAALALLSEHGFEGTSLQQIADRRGTTKAAVCDHRSEDDLLGALVEPAIEELHALHGLVAYLLRHRTTAAWMSRDAVALTRPAVRERARNTERRLEALLTGGGSDPVAGLNSSLSAGYRAARCGHASPTA